MTLGTAARMPDRPCGFVRVNPTGTCRLTNVWRKPRVLNGGSGCSCLRLMPCTQRGTKSGAMASLKKSFEGLKGSSHSAVKGVTETAVQAAQEAVQQVADSSKETANAVAQEASKQSQAAIGKAANKATDTIKELGQKRDTK
ncbi:adipogenesis regulatory factor [Syngnathus scovelli]|uniref:adipogenesis regulatory factor n=1 Tax=Syngnathus scovelli TaxID=161590 RepID=UPI0035CB94BB